MKRIVRFLIILSGAALIFLAAEILPVAVSRYDDRQRCGNIILEEDVTAAGKIAYEISYGDKLQLLANIDGRLDSSVFTKVYQTRTKDGLDAYDKTVIPVLKDCIRTMKNDRVIPIDVTMEELEKQLTDASCISAGSGQNGMGALTLWILTFKEENREWQFLLDTAEERLYAMYICDDRLSDAVEDVYYEEYGPQDGTDEEYQKEMIYGWRTELFYGWCIDRLSGYFNATYCDGVAMEIPAPRDGAEEYVYVPLGIGGALTGEAADSFWFRLGDEGFYRMLADVTGDLGFADIVVYSEETAEEKAAQDVNLNPYK